MKVTALKKDYYTIEESLKIIQDNAININESDIYYYGENGKLALNLYIGSRPAYAAKHNYATQDTIFIGHCDLHGIFPLRIGDVCALITKEKHIIDFVDGHPYCSHVKLNNWSTLLPKDAQQSRGGFEQMWSPEQYSPQIFRTINLYYLRPKILMQFNEGLPGAIIPFSALPDKIIDDALKFGFGTPKQWAESQLFNKKDLRITDHDLQNFIAFLKKSKLENLDIKLSPPKLSEPTKKDKRSTHQSQALRTLAKYVWANGTGKNYTAFATMLGEHSPLIPYEGFGDCTNIYLQAGRMHFTLRMDEGTYCKVDIDITSMKYHFTNAKKIKTPA